MHLLKDRLRKAFEADVAAGVSLLTFPLRLVHSFEKEEGTYLT